MMQSYVYRELEGKLISIKSRENGKKSFVFRQSVCVYVVVNHIAFKLSKPMTSRTN